MKKPTIKMVKFGNDIYHLARNAEVETLIKAEKGLKFIAYKLTLIIHAEQKDRFLAVVGNNFNVQIEE